MSGFNHNNSVLRICVDRTADHSIGGRILSRRLTAPLSFSDLSDLVLQMEAVFEHQNFPQAYQRMRTFLRSEKEASVAAADPAHGMSEAAVRDGCGAIATFEVTVVSRRNSTWQGFVNWLDGSDSLDFASYLELMHLISKKQF